MMDYEFKTDLLGRHVASFPMGHEALGYWLSSDLGNNAQRIEAVFKAIHQIQSRQSWEFELEGAEYTLHLSPEEAIIRAHSLYAAGDAAEFDMNDDMGSDDPMDIGSDINNDMDYYDSEFLSQCGLDDFKELLTAWTQFVNGANGGFATRTK